MQSHYGDPVLCYWQYGLGKTVAWTSDMTGEWSANYSGWENTQLMWHNIIQYVTQDMGMEGAYVEVQQNGSRSEIHYTTENFSADTEVIAMVFDDEGNATEVVLDPVKPGEYIAEIETATTGVYTINVQQKEGEEVVSSMNTAAINQYSLEYRFYPENTLMEEYVASVGGSIITEASEVFATQPEHVKSRWNLSTILLVMAAVWFVWDIAVRRFHLDLSKLVPVEAMKRKSAARKEKADEKRLLKAEKKAQKEATAADKKSSSNAALQAGAMMAERSYESSAPQTNQQAGASRMQGKAVQNSGNITQQMKRSSNVRVWTKGGGEVTGQNMARNNVGTMPAGNQTAQPNNAVQKNAKSANKGKKELLNTQALLRGLEKDE